MTIFTTPHLAPPQLRAVHALLVYEDRSDCNGEMDCAVTTHEIEHSEHGIRLGPGRLFAQEDREALLDILLGATEQESAFLPPEIVARGSAQLAWVVPAQVRPMWFRLAEDRTCHLNVPWPTLLFAVHRGSLRLAALADAIRPAADTPLYHAPLMNVHTNTSVCTGNAPLPAGCSLVEREGWEAAIFATNFSHVNHEHTLSLPDDEDVSSVRHLRFWRSLDRSRAGAFPVGALVPLNQSVSQWLASRMR